MCFGNESISTQSRCLRGSRKTTTSLFLLIFSETSVVWVCSNLMAFIKGCLVGKLKNESGCDGVAPVRGWIMMQEVQFEWYIHEFESLLKQCTVIHNTVRTVFITLESYHRNDHLNLMHCVAVSIVFNKISTFFFFLQEYPACFWLLRTLVRIIILI